MITPYRIIFFDNDGTLNTGRSTWKDLHEHFGTWEPEGRLLEEKLMATRTPYDDYCRVVTAMWECVPKKEFFERLMMIEVRKEVPELVRSLREMGFKLAVLSSGFTMWKDIWRDVYGIEWDHYRANEILFDENDFCTGEIDVRVTDNVPGLDKGTWVEKISKCEGIPYEERVFIGDGWGDVPGFKKCALSIAVDPNMPEVNEAADVVLSDTELLKIIDLVSETRQ